MKYFAKRASRLYLQKKIFLQFYFAGAFLSFLALFSSCDNGLSSVGSSLRPGSDALVPAIDSFLLQAKTIQIDSVYDRSTYALLGHFRDPFYGNYRASYISRFQSAPGFKFSIEPYQGKIKQTYIRLRYNSWAGDSTVWSQARVFEIKTPLPDSRYSRDLSPFLKGAEQIGSLSYQAAKKNGVHELMIPINNEIGQRIYNASKENPQFFNTQKSFEENIIRGVYVEASTGSGCMISIYNTDLVLEYEYSHKGKNKDKTADSTYLLPNKDFFTNTSLLYLHRHFETKNVEKLLRPDPHFAYITSPQGLALSLTIKAEDIQKRFIDQAKKQNMDLQRMINGASLELLANLPPNSTSILQPAPYLLLFPKDSLTSIFEEGQTELTNPSTIFLSSSYSVTKRKYTFSNISPIFNEHIRRQMKADKLDKDLELIAVPVARETSSQNGGGKSTIRLSNYLFPSAVRVQLNEGMIKIKTISTLFQRSENTKQNR